MARTDDCVARASKLIAAALARKAPKWSLPHHRPTEALRTATGIDVGAPWRLPTAIDPHQAELALKIVSGNVTKRSALSRALVEAFAIESPALFAELSIRVLTTGARPQSPDPYHIAHGMLSGLPPACIADWHLMGNAVQRSWAHRDRVARVEDRVGADIFWVASDETLSEILRQHEQRRAARRAARANVKAEAAEGSP